MRTLFLILCLTITASCAKAPVTLTPQGVIDWNTIQIGHDLDLLRDIVDAGTKTTPAIFTRDADVKVATWHKAAVTTLAVRGAGWQMTIQTGLDQLLLALPQNDRVRLTPYAQLIADILVASR